MTPSFEQAFLDLARKVTVTHVKWHHTIPMIITRARMEEFSRLQRLLCQAIHHFVEHYGNCASLMPVPAQVERILELASARPYKIGTHRPDFVIDATSPVSNRPTGDTRRRLRFINSCPASQVEW